MDEMRKLVDKLNDYAYRYYVLDEPVIADAEYDKLYDKLVEMENQTGVVLDDSPRQTLQLRQVPDKRGYDCVARQTCRRR